MSEQQLLINYLIELRKRLLKCIIAIVLLFLAMSYFANDLYNFIAVPLINKLPHGTTMIATHVITPFYTPLKLTFISALFLVMPYILYQIWAFIAPALYKHEKKFVFPLLFSSSLLFYLGILFAYYCVFPLMFALLTNSSPEGVIIAPDISQYLDLVLTSFMVFGICFEVPILIFLLCWSGITSPAKLSKKRPYIIVLAFVVSMFVTPPDAISLVLLAVPICVLFELGLWIAKIYLKPQKAKQE